ncbi:MAG: type IX secretion system membrane protein PorP/SprF [Bacteroidales bacterium]|nr:type IX secretion system membrane protein PorP/SprF [Bacteroidales bacterium]
MPLKPRYIISTLVLALSCLLPQGAAAQVDAQLSQYYEMPAYYNAAAIGLTDYVHIRGGARLQWVGVDNAPQTFLIGANMPFKFLGKRWGVGLIMQQESIGLYRNLNIGAQLAYKLKLFGGQLSAGLQLGFMNEQWKGTDVYIPDDDDYHESEDPAIPKTDIAGNAFDMGLGLWYTHRYFWAGVSMTHLNSPTITMSGEGTSSSSTTSSSENTYEFQAGRVLYFMAGSNIAVKNTLFEVMPSVFYKTDFQFWTAEATARVRYNKMFTLGVGYRYKDAIIATLAAEIKGFYLGYSYDYSTSAIGKVSSGSHEIIAGYSLKLDLSDKNKNKHKSIRIM